MNSKIQLTIQNQPEMFFAFNNGIAATAEDVSLQQTESGLRIVSATNLQIVNGGQTTASIAMAGRTSSARKEGADLSKVMVQMKLSVLPPKKPGHLFQRLLDMLTVKTKSAMLISLLTILITYGLRNFHVDFLLHR